MPRPFTGPPSRRAEARRAVARTCLGEIAKPWSSRPRVPSGLGSGARHRSQPRNWPPRPGGWRSLARSCTGKGRRSSAPPADCELGDGFEPLAYEPASGRRPRRRTSAVRCLLDLMRRSESRAILRVEKEKRKSRFSSCCGLCGECEYRSRGAGGPRSSSHEEWQSRPSAPPPAPAAPARSRAPGTRRRLSQRIAPLPPALEARNAIDECC